MRKRGAVRSRTKTGRTDVLLAKRKESRRGYKYAAPPAANVHRLTYRPD